MSEIEDDGFDWGTVSLRCSRAKCLPWYAWCLCLIEWVVVMGGLAWAVLAGCHGLTNKAKGKLEQEDWWTREES